MNTAPKRLFTVQEGGDYLGFGRSKMWDLLKSNKIASVKLGSSRRIELSELDRYIEENATPA